MAAALLLAGCADVDWGHVPGSDTRSLYPDAVPVAVGYRPASPAAYCTRTARERSIDSAEQGFDADVQQAVYDKTYADCLKWAERQGRR